MTSDAARLELNRLRIFFEATRAGGYTAAARRLHLTPSAVSHAVRTLEEGAGRRLVEWRHRRLALTDDGEYVREVCERVFQELDHAEHVLATRAPGTAQAVTVGATVEFGTTVLVRKLRPLVEQVPWLRLHFAFRDDLEFALLNDEVDVAVDCAPHTHPSLTAIRLFREKYLIVASPAFLRAHPVRRPLDLGRVPVISIDRDGGWWANALRSVPGRQRPVLRHVIEVDQVRGMVHAALEGYGVALLPKYTAIGKVARGELTALFPALRLLEDWFCVYQKRTNALRRKNRVLTEFLTRMDVTEFGDAIRGPRRRAGLDAGDAPADYRSPGAGTASPAASHSAVSLASARASAKSTSAP
jgi:DNA-binding transcriptional LysR family regulator